MFAIYAFCRMVDDIADDQIGARPERADALNRWHVDIDALYTGGDPGQAEFLLSAVQRFNLERANFHAVLDGMMTDVEQDVRWPDADALDLYCDRVASAVGRLSIRIFGMDNEPGISLAYHLGRALQLTNILRDIDEDATIGRVYLPRELLTDAGIPLSTPAEVTADSRLDTVCRALAVQAHHHFEESDAILSTRPRGHRIAPRLMSAAYSKVLGRMEQVGWMPPRQRVRVNKLGLIWTLVRLGLTN